MRQRTRIFLGALLALVAASVVGMSLASAQDGTVNVELNEWNVLPGVSSVAAGDVEFVASNTGANAHELVVIRTDLAPDTLPIADGRLDEHGAGIEIIGEIEPDELPAGATASATFALTPGSYALICNVGEVVDETGEVIPAHYLQGMFVGFTVTGTGAVSAAPAAGTGGLLSQQEDGFSASNLALLLAALGAAVLVAGGSWAILRPRRS